MLPLLLNTLYGVTLTVLSPVIAYTAWRTGKYREGYREKLLGWVPRRSGNRHCVWVHAVSVGEVNLLATTLKEMATRQPEWEVVLSTTTKTGYDLARKKYGDRHTVFYCPLDFSWAVRQAMQRIRPNLLVLAELELWPNLIAAAKSHGARVAIINGRLSENSFQGYQRVRWLAQRVLRQVDLIAAQDEATAERFRRLANEAKTVVTGSLKYDGAETDRNNPRTVALRQLVGLTDQHPVLLAGSTQAPEEAIAIRVFQNLRKDFPQARLVLVPRHPERFDEVAKLLDESGLDYHRRSNLENAALPVPSSALLIDTVGELGAWWGAADIGFVGGSFGDRGGQNMIEPAAYGVATCFGPNTRNFRDIVAALLGVGGAVVVQNEQQLEAFAWHCLSDPAYAQALGARAQRFVGTQLGATDHTVSLLEQLFTAPMPARRAA